MKKIIFQNYGTPSLEEGRKDYIEYLEYNEYLENEIKDMSSNDDKVYNYLYEQSEMWYDDEKSNLNIELDEDVICIANIGLWDGRRKGYKVLSNNLNSILTAFSGCDYIEFFIDDKELQGRGSHHDGTHYVTFRTWKKNVSESNKDKCLNAIYDNSDNVDELIKKYTKSLAGIVNKIYGWSNE